MSVRAESQAEPIPGYRLIERIGGGGFGEVWKAEAPGGLQKAIKFVFGDLSSAGDKSQRADQELKALKRVQTVRHPYILSLERYDIIDGQLMIVMELAEHNLWDRFKECRAQGHPGIPREELLRYVEEAAEALDLMNNEYQLQHLDIKPQNLFVVHQHVKVADFGLVKDLEGSQASITGGITPVYAAPETFDGKVTRFSDQYSLAIVYQELLTGQRPFSGANVRQLILQHLQATPDVSPLPPEDQAPILRALSKHPTERFPTCRELAEALRAAGAPPPVSPSKMSGPAAPSALTVPGSVLAAALASPASGPGAAGHPAPLPSQPTDLRGPAPDTGATLGSTQRIRALESGLSLQPSEGGFRAPPEVTGNGVLFPALVIGLGQMGMTVMQGLREALHTLVAPLTQLPHLRFLLLDTDPDVVRAATRGAHGSCLSANEVQLAQLNRPSYYIKTRDGRTPLEPWFNPRMIYRIPRSQLTAGVRALGRLAFCDNFRGIVRRLRLELEAALAPQELATAAKNTSLGVRTNRPRVYVVTGLSGGTGSGMFIDVAYTVRALLLQMGYESPDVVGLLLAPPVDGSRTRLMTLGNTYAALTELEYFGRPDTVFHARHHDREPAIQDSAPPFSRTVILPLPDESDEVATAETVELCGQMLYRDLATPLGKAADLGRAGLPSPAWEARGQYYQSFGLFQLTWPRHALLQGVARGLVQRVVTRWMSKDSKPFRQAIQEWVQQQWAQRELGADSFIHRAQAEMVRRLSGRPESLFAAAVEPLTKALTIEEPRPRSRAEARGLPPDAIMAALTELEALVGRPDDEHPPEEPPRLLSLIRQISDKLAEQWGQQLAELSVHLIEAPAFRLAGAEEAIRQVVTTIEQALQHHEPLAKELAQKAREAYECLRAYASPAQSGGRKMNLSPAEVVELARAYPKWRYQALILNHLASAFVGLRGHLSDELREVNFCRVRLGELLRSLEAPQARPSALGRPGGRKGSIGRRLYFTGCRDGREAVERLLETVTPEHILDLDGRIEEMLKVQFTALVHVCMTTANIVKDVEAALLRVACDFAAELLPNTTAADLFFEQHPEPEEAEGEVARYFDEAAPELSEGRAPRKGPPVVEMVLLATPEGPASEAFRETAREALPELEIHHTASPDDILIYRERANLPLADLEQLGPIGHDAYMQMTATENFTPHSRCDIDFKSR